MPLRLIIILSIAGIVGAFLLLMFVVSYLEKQLITPYIEIDPENPKPDVPAINMLSPYVAAMSEGAWQFGFMFGSMFAAGKYPSVKIGGVVWMTPDRRVLMYTGSGTVAGMPSSKTMLVSLRSDGMFTVTLDTGTVTDHTKTEISEILWNATPDELIQLHLRRINSDPLTVGFGVGRPFDLLIERSNKLNELKFQMGKARYRGTAKNTGPIQRRPRLKTASDWSSSQHRPKTSDRVLQNRLHPQKWNCPPQTWSENGARVQYL